MTFGRELLSFFQVYFLLLTGCSAQKIEDVASRSPAYIDLKLFEGDSIAYGIFEDYSQKLSRQFRVDIKGIVEDATSS